MRAPRLGPLFAFGFLFSVTAIQAQQSAGPATPTKDPQALAVLAQCLQASGGSQAIAAIQDFTGTGTITHYWAGQEVQDPATVRALGMSDFRSDDDRSDGTYSWAVSQAGGMWKDPDGTTSPMPWGDAVNLMSATWPLPTALSALNNPSWQVTNVGQTMFNGRAAYDVKIEQILPLAADPKGTFSSLTVRDIFIDSSSFLILGVQDVIHPNNPLQRTYSHQILYSDYRLSGGVSVPFSVTETISGQKIWTFTLNSISFNNGLTVADFTL